MDEDGGMSEYANNKAGAKYGANIPVRRVASTMTR